MSKKKKRKRVDLQEIKESCMNPKSITFTFDPEVTAVVTLQDGTEKTLTEGVSPVAKEIVEIDVPFTDGTSAVFKKV